jgi:4-amino-4-deoxy-L-arabinose transferase-like glycosyltransferase
MQFSRLFKKLPTHYYPAIVLILPIIITCLFWRLAPSSLLNNDETDYTQFYLPVAQNILHGKGISFDGRIALEYPPGYPLILAATLAIVKPLHCSDMVLIPLCLSLCALLIFMMAKIFWDPARALLASVAWCFYPFVYWAGMKQASEIPFMVVFYAGILCFLKGWRSSDHAKRLFFACGALFGVSMLIRPIAIGVGVLIALTMLFWRERRFGKRIVFAACVIIGNIIAVLPWEAWVYHKTHEVVMLCKGRDSFSIYDGLTFAVWNPAGYRQGTPVPRDVEQFMKTLLAKYPPEATTTRRLFSIISAEFRHHPATVIKLFLIKAARSWYGTNSNRFEKIILLYQLIFMTMLVIAGTVFWRSRPQARFIVVVGAVFLFYFWGMSIMVLSIIRYLVPMLGLLLLLFPAIPIGSSSSFPKAVRSVKPTQ